MLTLLVVAVVVVQVLSEQEVAPLWTETLMIALAHYFTSRRFIHLPADVIRRLQSDGHVEIESNPLYLPKHSIRVLVLAAFVGLTVYLYQNRLLRWDSPAVPILGVVFAYLLGNLARVVVAWWNKGRPSGAVRGWEDAKAAVVLIALCITAAAYLLNHAEWVQKHIEKITLALVLFYFGSR